MRVRYKGKDHLLNGSIFNVRAIVPNGEMHPYTLSVNNSGQNKYICTNGCRYSYTFLESELEVMPESKVIWL